MRESTLLSSTLSRNLAVSNPGLCEGGGVFRTGLETPPTPIDAMQC